MHGSSRRGTTTVLAAIVVFLTISLVLFPKEGIDAGMSGMRIFFEIVIPSLLPFFILSEMMLGIGVVHALGVLLEPLMRPLFSVPGSGAFALSMGLAAGYPMDAVITSRFRKNKMCSRVEGERLLAFTNTADPLFMFGAVAVQMFRIPGIGILLALAHYLGAFVVGILFKLYGRGEEQEVGIKRTDARGNIFARAYQEMFRARQEDGRPITKLLGDSVNDSVRTLLMIGGFIIFFAVLIKVLSLTGIIPLLSWPFLLLFNLLGFDLSLVNPLLSGIFEIDIGAAQAAAVNAPLIQQLLVVSFIIAWSGLSVHAQVASVLTGTDIRFAPYVVARVLHGILAAIFTVVLFNWGIGQPTASVLAQFAPASFAVAAAEPTMWARWAASLIAVKNWALLMGGLTLLSVTIYLLRHMKIVYFRTRLIGK